MKSLALLFVCGAAVAADPAAIPVEKFFQKPAMTGATISPDGRHVAVRMQSSSGRSILKVINVETREQNLAAGFANGDVRMFYWLDNRRLAYSFINVDYRGGAGKPGLYAVDRDGTDFTPLSETVPADRSFADTDDFDASYLREISINGFRNRKPDTMYVISATAQDKVLARISTRIGQPAVSDVRAPSGTYKWLTGPDGEVRIAVAKRSGKDVVFYFEDKRWRELASFAPDAPEAFTPVLYTDEALYVSAYKGNNEAAIYRYDLGKNSIADTPTITVPGFDANGYFLLGDKDMRGYRIHTDSENTVWFDPAMKALQKEVDDQLPGTINTLSYGDHSETPYALIDAHRDIQDHIYFLYNRDTKKLTRLGAARPDLDPDSMAPVGLVRYPARDGMQIPVYLTMAESSAKKPAPTVVLIGDTQGKRNGHWEWNEEVQFLASRGYVVLQPDPRGTRGFGAAHEKAGVNAPEAVIDDIFDAVKWAVKQGYTDAARVCIAGSGYGGYVAMKALARDATGFKCGISWSGATANGDDKIDTARITQPVLLAYGKEDIRVPYSEGRKFYTALAATDPKVEWLEYTPTVESWKTQSNRIDLWRHIDTFLQRNIGLVKPGL